MPTDRDLARGALSGDIGAAELLLCRYDAELRQLARSQIWRPGDAGLSVDDLMQDFCVKIFQNRFRALAHWKGLTEPAEPSIQPYFARILRNLMIDQARQHNRRRDRELPYDDGIGEQGHSSDTTATDVDMRDAIRRCIESALNDRQRQVVMLALAGRPHGAIAQDLNITPENSRVLLHRAFAALRACIEQGGRNGPGPGDVEE